MHIFLSLYAYKLHCQFINRALHLGIALNPQGSLINMVSVPMHCTCVHKIRTLTPFAPLIPETPLSPFSPLGPWAPGLPGEPAGPDSPCKYKIRIR